MNISSMDWFERITGFPETSYERTNEQLIVDGWDIVSRADATRHAIGRFEMPTLNELRTRVAKRLGGRARSIVECQVADARALHADPACAGALFQVASQFNALEMVSPDVPPEAGVTRYLHDHTQGPACAIAAGAATIWRNYRVPVGSGHGQTQNRQLDTLAMLGGELARMADIPVEALWRMRNGYALCSAQGLSAIADTLRRAGDEERDALRGRLAIALHIGADATDLPKTARHQISQAFCAALPVAYTQIDPSDWAPFASLVLEASYEATLLAALLYTEEGRVPTAYLTRLGGGVFGNLDPWIDAAIGRALQVVEFADLRVVLVGHRTVHDSSRDIKKRWAQPPAR